MPWVCFWSIWWGERCRRLSCAPEPCTPRAQWPFHHGRGHRSMSRSPASQRHTGKTSARETGQLNTTLTRSTPLQKPSTWRHDGELMNEHSHTLILPEGQVSRSLMEETYHTLSKNRAWTMCRIRTVGLLLNMCRKCTIRQSHLHRGVCRH